MPCWFGHSEKEIYQAWADYLDVLRDGTQVIPIKLSQKLR